MNKSKPTNDVIHAISMRKLQRKKNFFFFLKEKNMLLSSNEIQMYSNILYVSKKSFQTKNNINNLRMPQSKTYT